MSSAELGYLHGPHKFPFGPAHSSSSNPPPTPDRNERAPPPASPLASPWLAASVSPLPRLQARRLTGAPPPIQPQQPALATRGAPACGLRPGRPPPLPARLHRSLGFILAAGATALYPPPPRPVPPLRHRLAPTCLWLPRSSRFPLRFIGCYCRARLRHQIKFGSYCSAQAALCRF